MKAFFLSQDLWDIVEKGCAEAEFSKAESLKEICKKDSKALLVLQQAVTDSIFPTIAGATKASEAWSILKEEFHGDSKIVIVKLQTLRREFENLHMKGGESINIFFSRVQTLVSQMKIYGEHVSDQKVVEKILRCLPTKFDVKVAAIEESKDLSQYTVTQLKGSLLSHEERVWFLDSGCSNHMTGNKSLFCNIDESIKLEVRLGDDKKVCIQGKGTIAVKEKSGTKRLIHNVYYVPGLAHNLLSVGQLIQRGYSVIFDAGICEIKNKSSNSSLLKIQMAENRMFPIKLSCFDSCALAAYTKDDSLIWHLRYGHLHFNGMKLLNDNSMVFGLPSITCSNNVCEGCVYGKQHRLPFPIGKSWRARRPLELVHADVCGPMRTPSMNNSRYFILFIDDFSRMSWVFFLVHKSDALDKFIEFRAFAEKECGYPIKVLRTDRGGEFLSHDFNLYCKKYGIRRQLTVRKTPEQNGIAERKNRTVVEMARCMLHEKSLSNKFWAEAVATSVYLLNISPTKAVFNRTPYEAWWKRKPNVSNLKVFGCIAYALINANERGKMDKKSEKCIFVGYSDETKGYRLYNPKTEKLIVRRDIIFQENNSWNWKPSCYEEACEIKEWEKSMKEEIDSIEKNGTWELVDLPFGKDVIGVKWIYKIKLNANDNIYRFKSRLVAKGYAQEHGINYFETYSPVARFETIRIILALAAQMRWNVFQFDVKTAFLNGYLEEDVYVQQPQGFLVKGKEEKVYKLKKALYGLKQAPRAWYSRLNSYLQQNGFQKSANESTLYTKVKENEILIVCVYVDDIIYTGSSQVLMKEFKYKMMQEFEMTNLGSLHYFLGLQILQTSDGIFLSQEKYALNLLKRFNMKNCKTFSTPMNANEKLALTDGTAKTDEKVYRSLVGGLMYLTHTRPDILFSVSLISRFMHKPSVHHFGAARRILRYVRATTNYEIWYKQVSNFKLTCFTDSDWAGSIDDRKSTSDFLCNLGSGAISWSSKKQGTTALSSSEAEYISACSTTCQAIWMRRILEDLHQPQTKATDIYCDNKATIFMAKNPVFHGRTKHIELRHHFIRSAVAEGVIELKYISTNDQIADGFTKALSSMKFFKFREDLGVQCLASRESYVG
ncbi:Retrovirus-related Pol polyprotein from transposon TNT 1-94 [Apostasia shenzhenica]|uniref:Retrovirus-related Pol polyprotein from transposon TNT 1-94 n=1 Tax=Apostasia shenzhenica TaxID=1088818 RepID=A0A2H9ZTW1_9ASPA|nr:Retrovirus-related Pol polyprotein from transposon TNT 1-94 [Apostasia shenzhenica]